MIEKIVDNEKWENIENEYLNRQKHEKLKEIILKNISINPLTKDDILKENIENVLDGVVENFNSDDKKMQLFSLSEVYLPIRICDKIKDLRWVYWNQCFNYDNNAKAPARGTDCVFIYKNEKIIINEIKSSTINSSKTTLINGAIDELNKFFIEPQALGSLFNKLNLRLYEEDKKLLRNKDNPNRFENVSFMISTFFKENQCNKKEIDVGTKELNSKSLSYYEMRIDKNGK